MLSRWVYTRAHARYRELDSPPQIIGPHDTGISNAIKANLDPKSWELSPNDEAAFCMDRTAEMCDAYFESLAAQSLTRCLLCITTYISF